MKKKIVWNELKAQRIWVFMLLCVLGLIFTEGSVPESFLELTAAVLSLTTVVSLCCSLWDRLSIKQCEITAEQRSVYWFRSFFVGSPWNILALQTIYVNHSRNHEISDIRLVTNCRQVLTKVPKYVFPRQHFTKKDVFKVGLWHHTRQLG